VRIAAIDAIDDHARVAPGKTQSKTPLPIDCGTDVPVTTIAPPPKAARRPVVNDHDESEPVAPGKSQVNRKKRSRAPLAAEEDDITMEAPSNTLTAAQEAYMEVDIDGNAIARSRMENPDAGSKRKHQESTGASAESHNRPRPTARSTFSGDATSENDPLIWAQGKEFCPSSVFA
jgi:hypothetical protein